MLKQIIFAALLLPTASLGTSIVALRGSRSVVIAADSKATYRVKAGPATICKISQSGPLFFAIAGLAKDSLRKFFPETIVARGFSSDPVFSAGVENVKRAMKDSLLTELLRMKKEDPDTYRYTLEDGGGVLSILLVEVQNDIPYVTGMGFQFTESPEPQVTVTQLSCPGDCPNGIMMFYLGRQDAAKHFVDAHRSVGPDPVQYVKHLVELEIEESPDDVGPPINVFVIDQSGPHWPANDAGCRAIVTPNVQADR